MVASRLCPQKSLEGEVNRNSGAELTGESLRTQAAPWHQAGAPPPCPPRAVEDSTVAPGSGLPNQLCLLPHPAPLSPPRYKRVLMLLPGPLRVQRQPGPAPGRNSVSPEDFLSPNSPAKGRSPRRLCLLRCPLTG